MSRIAVLSAVLTIVFAPAAMAVDLRSPDARDLSRPAVAKVVDLRSPDARDAFVAPAPATPRTNGGGASTALVVSVGAALAVCAALVTMVRRQRHVGRPAGV